MWRAQPYEQDPFACDVTLTLTGGGLDLVGEREQMRERFSAASALLR